MQLFFPDHGDPHFQEALSRLEEFRMYATPPRDPVATQGQFDSEVARMCGGFEKTLYQHLMGHYLSRRKPYRGLLLFHGLGVGKTCAASTIAEALLQDHRAHEPPPVWVVLPGALQRPFEDAVATAAKLVDRDQVHEQCTDDTYRRLMSTTATAARGPEAFAKRLASLIHARYQFFTYDRFATFLASLAEQGLLHTVRDKVILLDEAHNLRTMDTVEKKVSEQLVALLDACAGRNNNRLVLMSATPMYNEPDELTWLLGLLLRNDGRSAMLPLPRLFTAAGEPSRPGMSVLQQVSQEYVSYLRGKNPFTFAVRLGPSDSGIATLKVGPRKPRHGNGGRLWTEAQAAWPQLIPDGLVPTPLGAVQLEALARLKARRGRGAGAEAEAEAEERADEPAEDAQQQAFSIEMQMQNIVYPSSAGAKLAQKGFTETFVELGKNEPLQVAYRPGKDPRMLMPGPHGGLAAHAAKMQRICEAIEASEGIVVVYSQYIWSGVVPLAIALEHMGFSRFGARNLCPGAAPRDPPARYPGIAFPTYCILSRDHAVMGATKIDALVKEVRTNNLRGNKIKVVLMTPVAGEGLSFANVREVHILDPWFHLNRLDQVIGRAIRTCSHTGLPLEERNVTVFLHAATDPEGARETTDLHAYRIAARKLSQMNVVERVVRDHAVDCPLLYHANFTSKDTFGFSVDMRTSQKARVRVQLGDDEGHRPACTPVAPASERAGVVRATLRTESYAALLPTAMQRLRKFLQQQGARRVFEERELLDAMAMPLHVARATLEAASEPGALTAKHRLVAHRNRFVVEEVHPRPPDTFHVSREAALAATAPGQASASASASAPGRASQVVPLATMFQHIPVDDAASALLMFLLQIDSQRWPVIASRMLQEQQAPSPVVATLLRALGDMGAFLHAHEVGRAAAGAEGADAFVGFVDLFTHDFVAFVRKDDGSFREATLEEVAKIKARRSPQERPAQTHHATDLYGFMEPVRTDSKDPTSAWQLAFKVMKPGPTTGVKRGARCATMKANEVKDLLETLGMPERAQTTNDQRCFHLSRALLEQHKLFLPPAWKPAAKPKAT